MSTKKQRPTMKNDCAKHWKIAGDHNFIPLAGEIIFYSDLNKIKIGDGITNINELSFLKAENDNLEQNIKSLIDKNYITSLLSSYDGDFNIKEDR